MREISFMVSSDLVSLSLAASWSASLRVHFEWPGMALRSGCAFTEQTEGVLAVLLLSLPLCCGSLLTAVLAGL